jgi:uncharacterized linocin/CFP29 family protein
MIAKDLQVPWTEEQWARVNQVIQEEVTRARVAATFLPLYGPLPADADFIRQGLLTYPPLPLADFRQQPNRIAINDRATIQLATLQVKVYVRSAQMADPEMMSVLTLFRRAANVLARLEDAVVFRGLIANLLPGPIFTPPSAAVAGLPRIWEITGGQVSPGLMTLVAGGQTPIFVPGLLPPPAPPGPEPLVSRVSRAILRLENAGHFGPFALVLGHNYFERVQTPGAAGWVLPQDQITPFLAGGPLLRSSVLNPTSGVVVALGGAPVELIVAADVSLQFLEITNAPAFLFRVREKIALRIKEVQAIVTLYGP